MKNFLIGIVVFFCVVWLLGMLISWSLRPQVVGPPIAPDPAHYTDAVIQVYGANVYGFRGNFAVHTWVAVKSNNASTYDIFQVIGWRLRRYGSVLAVSQGMPNTPWFRSPPQLLYELRGAKADQLVDKVVQAAKAYPYAGEYVMWPGPNSNSFTAWIALEVPELGLDLPAKAIGKNWMIENYD